MARAWTTWRAALAVAVAVIATFLLPVPAHADGVLIASEPRPHEELTSAPGWVVLAFDQQVDRSLAKLIVLSSTGKNVTTGTLIVEGTNVTTQLVDGLPRDTYTVLYRINSGASSVQGGSFQFSYGPGTWSAVVEPWKGAAHEPPIMKNPDPHPDKTDTAMPTESISTVPVPSAPASTRASNAAPSQPQVTSERPATPTASPSGGGTPGASATQRNDWGLPVAAGIVALALVGAGARTLRRRSAQQRDDHEDHPAG